MEFYTNVSVFGSKILYRGIKDGKRVQARIPFTPSLYTETKSATDFKSLYGGYLNEHTFASIPEAREFAESFKDVSNTKIYGNNKWQYNFIASTFRGQTDFDYTQIKKVSLDIETAVELGNFPNPKEALEEVLLITIMDFETKKMVTLGSRESDSPNYIKCASEADLLHKFIRLIRGLDPDIITGWNVEKFDIAYLGTRCSRILGEEAWSKISPWERVRSREVGDNKELVWEIEGITVLDYLDLYKKFTYTTRENYKLDHIADVELGERKLKSPYETFKEFYDSDFSLFISYNQKDVELVDRLETKLGLIFLATTLAYLGKVNYGDVFSPVKTWENFILSTLSDENTFVPLKTVSSSSDTIVGAYVKDVVPGFYKWIASADAASLYPSIIIALNMSPETIQPYMESVNVDSLLNGYTNDTEFAMAANGSLYSKDKEGILPRLMRYCLDGRKTYKKKMLSAKQMYNDTGDIQYKKEADKCHVMQLALKIFANSGYGGLANQYFQFFDNRLAAGITTTGQYLIRTVENTLNQKMNTLCQTEGVDYAFYGDTDSVYFRLDKLVEKYYANMDPKKTVEILVKVCEQKINKFIDAACDQVHTTLNVKEQSLVFKIEAVADSGFWVAKKKYALRYYFNEGVWYDNGELKVMGIEIVRSSTPAIIRDWLKDALPYILNGKKDELLNYIDNCRNKFNNLTVEQIAFPRSANNLKQYSDSSTIYRQATPIAVRGSLLYNFHITKLKLDKKYELIREGNKIKFVYLKVPNVIRENIISFPGTLPPELFDVLKNYIDYDLQFQKTFVDPLQIIMDAIQWKLKEESSLESFF